MFLKIMLEKQIFCKKWPSIKKKQGFLSKRYEATFVQQNDNFLRDPKRRLTQENQEKEYQETQKNQ